jgi:diguanylate cyclase (GGDEF)-like protein
MVMRIGLDERLHYVSPSCARVVGWTDDQLTGTPALAGVNADDLPRVQRIVTALATLDGLTGLANRRHFDEKLQDEWAYARRDGTPLSLLMMDVDYFKRYNDQYGHQAGDECLASVARIIAGQALRPADLAARYGGEEFVLLLPGTDAAGCEQVGERIRQALHDLQLPHAMNPPAKCVTISLGGATGWPNAKERADQTSLVAAADSALYGAKSLGRNRLVMSGQVVAWPNAESA